MRLLKAFATVGSFTMMSRVLGFVRDIMMAAVLGSGAVADAFFVAFRIPNLFRRVFGEGAFNSAFIPLFARRLEGQGAEEARKFAEQVASFLVFVLIILTALAEIFMPWIMFAMAWGFSDTPEKFDLAVVMTRITFPYLIFVSLLALFSGILNAFGKFAAAAFAPVLLNVVFILVLAVLVSNGFGASELSGLILASAVTAAGVLQLLVVMFASRQIGMVLRIRPPRLTPGVRRLLALGIPGVIAGGITQINIIIGTFIATLQDGAVSWLYYADRLYQLPLGVVGIAIGVVLLPDLSRKFQEGNRAAAFESQNRSLEFSLILTLPAALALFIIPDQIISVLFERGAFSAQDTQATSLALAAFALGLPAFVLIKVFSPGFFANEDTRTPMYFAGISMIVNVVMSFALFWWIGHVGIAVATSFAGWVNALLLWKTLTNRNFFVLDSRTKSFMVPLLASVSFMIFVLLALEWYLEPYFGSGQTIWIKGLALASMICGGFLAFIVAAQVTKAFDFLALTARLLRR
ncbi:MAG: murein biosynthesis integral membrane protein MurJ [Methyloligellaceae bacterium]